MVGCWVLTTGLDWFIVLFLNTIHPVVAAEKYVGMTAPPVPINLKDLFLNRAQETATEEEQEKMAAKQAKANKSKIPHCLI